ncbi:MAG TPA: OmpA family protein [Chitinophagales bacterium]|nr:OmpA family protein [Chitinophagales bacterium]
MKNYIWTFIALLCWTNGMAQHQDRIQAVHQFEQTNYHSTIKKFLELENKGLGDFETKIILAQSYYAQRNFQEALDWLKKASTVNELSEKYKILLAELYKINGNLVASDSIFLSFGDQYKTNISSTLRNIAPSTYNVLTIANLNTNGDEFSPSYYRDGIAFIGNTKSKKSLYDWNNRPWLTIYQIPFLPTGKEKTAIQELELPKVNNFHGGPVSFIRQSKMIYFSHNQNLDKKNKSTTNTLGIYSAMKRGKKWTELKPISLNNPTYSISHPTLSEDGKVMYFVSDMPGGLGGTDIYYSRNSGNRWSTPINLGPTINTTKNELFPFLHKDGMLYFASEGHAGYGGLDIFYSKFENGLWTTPVNMGKPINSGYDDFGLILDKNKNNGYFSSNRTGGAGNDDIYRLISTEYLENQKSTVLKGTVVDKNTNEFIKNATITLLDQNQNPIEAKTDHLGYYQIELPSSFEKGHVLTTFSQYFPSDIAINSLQDLSSLNIELQRIELNKSIIIPNIYYDFDKADISNEAAKELNKLHNLLIDNPTWIIEIGSHTDSRADAKYNNKLSEKRAENVVKYLISNGISKNKLFAKGYGESQLLNECADKVKCSEEQHAINRRTEFKLIGFEQLGSDEQTMSSVIFDQQYVEKNDLIYKIQIGVYKQPDEKWLQKISDLGNIEKQQVKDKELYKIFISSYPNYETAKSYLDKVHQRGLTDAFIVPFFKGEAITIDEANQIKNK